MLFSHSKFSHLFQILGGGLFSEVVVTRLAPPSPDEVQAWGSMLIQLAVAIVTIWATVRKALQKPEAVLKVPAGAVAAVAAPAAATVQSVIPPTLPDGDAE